VQRKDATALIVLIAALLLAAAAGALHRPAGPAAESVKGGGWQRSAALAKTARNFFWNRNSRIFLCMWKEHTNRNRERE
jgi:hypothetical protein